MSLNKYKMIGNYVLEGIAFLRKRNKADYPSSINSVVVDLDYTILNSLTAYRALEKMVGKDQAKIEYKQQKELVKAGKTNFAGVKQWGHELQIQNKWTNRDWEKVAREIYNEGRVNYNLIEAIKEIKLKNPKIKLILTTGTSSVLGNELSRILKEKHGFSFDFVVGSEQYFNKAGEVIGLKHFVGETHKTIPTIEKIPAIQQALGKKGIGFNPKNTLAISDADSLMLKNCGIGILIPAKKSQDPQSYASQKFGHYDFQAKYDVIRKEFISQFALNTRQAIELARTKVKTSLGKTNALSQEIIRRRIKALERKGIKRPLIKKRI